MSEKSVQAWVTSKVDGTKTTFTSYSQTRDNREETFNMAVLFLARRISRDLSLPLTAVLDDLEHEDGLQKVRSGWEFYWQTSDKKYKLNMKKPKGAI